MPKKKKKQSSTEPTDIFDAWMDFSKDINDRIQDITMESATEYEELYKVWSEYARKMTETMAKISPEDTVAFEDLQNIWSKYSGRMGDQFMNMAHKDDGPYQELYELWSDYSNVMGERLSDLVSENLKNQKELYELWMDAFGIKDNGHLVDASGPFGGMDRLWQDIWEQSTEMFTHQPKTGHDFSSWNEKWQEIWLNAYSKWAMNTIRTPEFAKMDGQTLNANLDMKKYNDQFVNNYLSVMGIPTKENMDEVYLKLYDLDRKISKIARSVNSRSKTRRK
jgi:hypothetical protein